MKNLLKLEYRRLFSAKSFYICMAVSLALILISALTTKFVLNAFTAITVETPEGMENIASALQAPTSLAMLKDMAGSSFTLILAIFLSIFVTEDYVGDTIKNFYAKGYSRDLVFFAKFIAALTGSLILLLANGLFSIFLGKALFGEFGTAGQNYVPSILMIVLLVIAYHSLYFAIDISIRKNGAAIAISILGPIVIGLLLSLGNVLIKSESIDLSEYWLSGRMSILSAADVATKDILLTLLVGGVITLAAGAVGFFLNRKRES